VKSEDRLRVYWRLEQLLRRYLAVGEEKLPDILALTYNICKIQDLLTDR